VPVKRKSKTSSKEAGDGASSAVKAKRSIKSKAAGKPKGDGTRAAARVAAPTAAPDPAKAAAARSASLKAVVINALDDMKALEIKVLDVRGLTDVADTMVIASGTSDRHVRSVAQKLVEKTKAAGFRPHGVEGQQDSDWVLIDLHEMIVHVMLPRVREFYGLEKLWDMSQPKRAARA
jgi:ribosome silencing factor RsfS/YbeB/iojap